jgi:hypothetical protein
MIVNENSYSKPLCLHPDLLKHNGSDHKGDEREISDIDVRCSTNLF